jgi:hypothetical protein
MSEKSGAFKSGTFLTMSWLRVNNLHHQQSFKGQVVDTGA